MKTLTAEYYTNQEVSWLAFNERVLDEARDKNNPLYERAKFLAITQSNMDEWFQVRVASLYQLRHVKEQQDVSGLSPHEQLKLVSDLAGQQIKEQYQVLNRSILPALEQHGLHIVSIEQITDEQRSELAGYYQSSVFPVLTPMADDQTRPFPFLATDSLNLVVSLAKGNEDRMAIVPIPDILPRVIAIPEFAGQYILLEDLIRLFIDGLFTGFRVKSATAFHILRDMELDVTDDEGPNLLVEVQQKLFERERGAVIRLVHEKNMPKRILGRLMRVLDVADSRVYAVNGPIDLDFLNKLVKFGSDPTARYPKYSQYLDESLSDERIFETIADHDVLLHHPYDSFKPVVNLIQQSAKDANVLAIKMVLYRVSGNSPIIAALSATAHAGKQVTVLVEVKARFDEENNVHWAQELERQGVHVIYGLKGLKVHAKVALVVRREGDDIKRYVHLGTGNYNDVTANFYTDFGLLTTDAEMGIDVASVFNVLTGYSDPDYFNQLYMSPDGIREALIDRLHQVRAAKRAGHDVKVRFKANSLSDKEMVDEIFAASQDGVPVDMLIRGITMLKPGIPGISENIAVHSIVGRMLEHSRIYIFEIDGQAEVFLSSADLMTRNLSRRVELMFPILEPALAQQVIDVFDTMWHDNVKTRVLQSNDDWVKQNRRSTEPINAQKVFIADAVARVAAQKQARERREAQQSQFEPVNHPF